MSFYETSNHVRKVKVFIPTSESPLLTTYGKLILPKLQPLKTKYEIRSQRKQQPNNSNPQTEYLSANDIDKLNRSYEAVKRSKGIQVKEKLKQTQYHLDPFYRSIYDLKHNALKTRAHSQRRSNIRNSIELSMSNSSQMGKN